MTKPTKNKTVDGKAELVPPVPKKLQAELASLEQKLSRAGKLVAERSEDLAYAVVEYGFFLLKIRAIYALSPSEAGKRKSLSHAETSFPDGEPVGFSGWLAANENEVPRGTAYRYINAALNAGLTENSNESAVAKLRENRALAAKKLSDLYKSPKQLAAPQQSQQLELDLIGDAIKDSARVCRDLINLHNEMEDDQLDAVVERLKKTLEQLTDAEWDMVDAGGKRKGHRG